MPEGSPGSLVLTDLAGDVGYENLHLFLRSAAAGAPGDSVTTRFGGGGYPGGRNRSA